MRLGERFLSSERGTRRGSLFFFFFLFSCHDFVFGGDVWTWDVTLWLRELRANLTFCKGWIGETDGTTHMSSFTS